MNYRPLTPEDVSKKAAKLFEQYNVKRAAVFGSCARNEMHRGSDIDILVEFEDLSNPLLFVELKRKIENLLKRKIDLISFGSLKTSTYMDHIFSEIKVIYEKH